MATAINQNLFRHQNTASAGINNLCTVIHQMKTEGVFLGEVVHDKRLLGTFELRYQKSLQESQVNVDLSRFDDLLRANDLDDGYGPKLEVGQEGYAVFYATGHHDGLYVKLTRIDVEKPALDFDSRKLGAGDMVVLRLWHPGQYTLANELGKQKASLKVVGAVDGKFKNPTKLEPTKVTLSDGGFDPAYLEKSATQALIVEIKTAASLTLKRLPDDKKPPSEPPTKQQAPTKRSKK